MNKTFRLMDLVEGARNLVLEYTCVKKGENICIYADTNCDALVIEAIACAAKEAGAEVVVIVSSELDDPGDTGLIDPPKIARNAFYASDVVIGIVSVFKMQFSTKSVAKALKEHGVRFAYVGPNTSEELASEWARFPADLAFAIGKRTLADLQKGGHDITITDENGTNLKARVEPTDWHGAGIRGPLNKPGSYAVIPATTAGTTKIKQASGRIFVDFLEIFGPSAETCELVVEDNWITDVRGGPQATIFRDRIFSIENANLLSQIAWGFNPKGRINKCLQPPWDKNKMAMISRFAGVMHIGVGSTAFHQGEKGQFVSAMHTHAVLLKPTVSAGNRLIIEKGRITALDDPEIRALAKKYSDPDLDLTKQERVFKN